MTNQKTISPQLFEMVKINKIKFYLCTGASLGIIVFLLTASYLVATEFCFYEKKYLSKEEKIEKAILHILNEYPPPVIVTSIGNGVSTESAPKSPIPYMNIQQFILENQNCCALYRREKYLEGGQVNFFEKLIGAATEVVEINYLVKFFDSNKDIKLIQRKEYLHINSCGLKSSD